MKKLTEAQRRVLARLADGWTLRYTVGAVQTARWTRYPYAVINRISFERLRDVQLICETVIPTNHYRDQTYWIITPAGRAALGEKEGQ